MAWLEACLAAGDIAPFEPYGPPQAVPVERPRPPLQRDVVESSAMAIDDSAVDLGEHRPPALLNAHDMATAELRCSICL